MAAPVMEESGQAAIRRALRALRRRHLLEEGAHSPAINALAKPFEAQAIEWKEKAEKMEEELKQCYEAQRRFSMQLLQETEESRTARAQNVEKEALIKTLQADLEQTREENVQLKESLDKKTKALDLLIEEHRAVRAERDELHAKLDAALNDNKELVDRWMLEKMKDAEKLNEANAMYEDMLLQQRVKAAGIGGMQQLAQQEAEGIVRRSEAGYLDSTSAAPSSCRFTLRAHEGGCGSLAFQHNSSRLISGGQDRLVTVWDAHNGGKVTTLQGSVGSILDLAATMDNRHVIAACSSDNLHVWDAGTGRIRHTLTGHGKKVCSVDASRVSAHVAASAALDHSIKIWDLNTGYCTNTIMLMSNCNALAFVDRDTVCSGHVDGSIRFWDARNARSSACSSQVAAHSHVTSVCVSRRGNVVLTTGKDGLHNLFDVRTMEVCGTFQTAGGRFVSGWGRSCISPDENYVAAGGSDGCIYVWSRVRGDGQPSVLEGQAVPVLACAWSELGQPLASADRNGVIKIWA